MSSTKRLAEDFRKWNSQKNNGMDIVRHIEHTSIVESLIEDYLKNFRSEEIKSKSYTETFVLISNIRDELKKMK